jgi:hypothetical protein
MKPKYPILIPSKGRAEWCHTMKAFDKLGLDYKAVIEAEEHDDYAATIGEDKLLVLPFSNKGLVASRNWIWDYAQYELETPWFWTFDDNIRGIYRYNHNLLTPCLTAAPLRCIEDFTQRYTNVVIAGMNYFMFVTRKRLVPAVNPNRRVYSNMFLKTNARDSNGEFYRNTPGYNDDTDLNLRVLKDGNCTLLFNAFLIDKLTTMTIGGGMGYTRSENKEEDSRWIASEQLRARHPDVTEIVFKFNRWHHFVDYRGFKKNLLKLREDFVPKKGINNYGMKLEYLKDVDPDFVPPDLSQTATEVWDENQMDLF